MCHREPCEAIPPKPSRRFPNECGPKIADMVRWSQDLSRRSGHPMKKVKRLRREP
jgi:hypothetical protein